jgi:hypothetical protein
MSGGNEVRPGDAIEREYRELKPARTRVDVSARRSVWIDADPQTVQAYLEARLNAPGGPRGVVLDGPRPGVLLFWLVPESAGEERARELRESVLRGEVLASVREARRRFREEVSAGRAGALGRILA